MKFLDQHQFRGNEFSGCSTFLVSCVMYHIHRVQYKNYMRGLQYNLTRMNSLLIRSQDSPTHRSCISVYVGLLRHSSKNSSGNGFTWSPAKRWIFHRLRTRSRTWSRLRLPHGGRSHKIVAPRGSRGSSVSPDAFAPSLRRPQPVSPAAEARQWREPEAGREPVARRGRAGGRAAAGHDGGLRREAERMWELDLVADGGSLRRRVPVGGRAAAPEGKEVVPRGSGGRRRLKEEAAVGLGDESRE